MEHSSNEEDLWIRGERREGKLKINMTHIKTITCWISDRSRNDLVSGESSSINHASDGVTEGANLGSPFMFLSVTWKKYKNHHELSLQMTKIGRVVKLLRGHVTVKVQCGLVGELGQSKQYLF